MKINNKIHINMKSDYLLDRLSKLGEWFNFDLLFLLVMRLLINLKLCDYYWFYGSIKIKKSKFIFNI